MYRLLVISAVLALVAGKAVLYERRGGKIVGGKNTTVEDHPHQVSVVFNKRHICGGSVVRPNIILSAAHCFYKVDNQSDIANYSVRAGSTFRNKGGVLVKPSKVYIHPKRSRLDYDVVVVILKEPLELGPTIQPIQLQEKNAPIPTNTLANVSGWGCLSESGPVSEILQVVEVPKVDIERCREAYAKEDVTDRMTCYGYMEEGGKDSCQGDSGGPLVVGGKLTGIVSWGRGCARPKYPGVYADLTNAEIHDFIREILKAH